MAGPPRLVPPIAEDPILTGGAFSQAWVNYYQEVADQLDGINAHVGVTDGSDAAPGEIGEFIASVVAGPGAAITNNVAADVTTIALPPGDWDVRGEVWFALEAGTAGEVEAAISTASASLPADAGQGARVAQSFVHQTMTAQVLSLAPCRISASVTRQVYLVARCGLTAGSKTAYGRIEARRVR